MTAEPLPPNLEGTRLEQAALIYLQGVRERIASLREQFDLLPTVESGSWLHEVDAKTRPFQTSELVRAYLSVAIDHLETCVQVLNESVPMLAAYSLIRPALEAASLGLGLLDTEDLDLAASKTLQVYWNDLDDNRKMWNTTMGREPDYNGRMKNLLENLHTELDVAKPERLKHPVNSTEIIKAVDDLHHDDPPEGFRGLNGAQVWRMSSAAAHANIISITQLLERHGVEEPGGQPLRTAKLSETVSAIDTAAYRTQSLLASYKERATAA